MRTPDETYNHEIVAVAVNGKIAAITRTFETDKGETAFGMMIPPDSLVDGPNDHLPPPHQNDQPNPHDSTPSPTRNVTQGSRPHVSAVDTAHGTTRR